MIFPILEGLVGFLKAPVTWIVVLLNFFVLVFTHTTGTLAQDDLERVMSGKFFIRTQGQIYASYLSKRPSGEYPEFLMELGKQVHEGDPSRSSLLGQLAFRDLEFLESIEDLEPLEDRVAFRFWKRQVASLREAQLGHPSFALGLSGADTRLEKWLSYIFVHSGWFHFFGNMLFLLLFGAALERKIGGLGFLVVFVLSGVLAAGVFVMMTGATTAPLVGASGAVSGVMSFFCILHYRQPVRYFYWFFLPFRGFMGFVYLPAWIALFFWIASDLAGYLSTIPEMGGVAHAAHLGGELTGLLTGLIVFLVRRAIPLKKQELEEPILKRQIRVGELIPFLPPQ